MELFRGMETEEDDLVVGGRGKGGLGGREERCSNCGGHGEYKTLA